MPPRGVARPGGGSHTTQRAQLSHVLRRLGALKPLTEHLTKVLVERPDGKMALRVRDGLVTRVHPYEHEAVGALLAHLMTTSKSPHELDLEGLRHVDEDGAQAVALLEAALAEPPNALTGYEEARIIQASIDAVPWREQGAFSEALREANAVKDEFVTAPTRQNSDRAGGPARVPFGKLFVAATYDTVHVDRVINSLLERRPPGRLARSLMGKGELENRPARLARLLKTLWEYRVEPGPQGPTLDTARLMLAFPDEGPLLVRALRLGGEVEVPDRPNYSEMAEVVDHLRVLPGTGALIDEIAHGPGLIPRKLESLEAVTALVPDDALAGKGLIGAQHLLTNTVPLIEACLQKGMSPQDVHLIGTPYNNNPLVIAYLKTLGVHIEGGHDNLASTLFLKDGKLAELEAFVRDVASREQPEKGWKILDDGGLLQKVIAGTERSIYGQQWPSSSRPLSEVFPRQTTEAVEQTTRGSTEVPHPSYPTVAVYRAPGKKKEGEYIGWALADSLVQELKQRGLPVEQTRVNIAGAGTIGLWAAELLRQAGMPVSILDVNEAVVADARARGFEATTDAEYAAEHSDVILSCSGKNIWPGDVLRSFRGLMLSGSSMAAEFDVDAINAFREEPLRYGNLGRPLNFHGDGHAVLNPDEIGITLALLFTGLVQSRADRPGYVDVDPVMEEAAIKAWPHAQGVALRPLGLEERKARRPDAVFVDGSATHEQWLSYLSSLRRPVYPPPNSVRGESPLYYFQGENGKPRVVDTRLGVSEEVPLPGVPRLSYMLNHLHNRQFLVTRGDDGREHAWLADHSNGHQFTPLGPFTKLQSRYVKDETPSNGPPDVQVGVAFSDGHSVKVLAPGASTVATLKAPEHDGLMIWPNPEVLLHVARDPPKVTPLLLGEPGLLAERWATLTVPSSVTKVEAIGQWPHQKFHVGVGRNAKGEVVVWHLDGGWSAPKLFTLPPGSTFRGARAAPGGLWGRFVIDYTLPGDPAELSSYRNLIIDLFEDR